MSKTSRAAAPFPCTKCGECCKQIPKLLPGWKDIDPKTGWCSHLAEDNTCKIYETRPIICQVEAYGNFLGGERIRWLKGNAKVCNTLQEQAGLPILYRIDVEAIK